MNLLGGNKKPGTSTLLATAWAGLRKKDRNDLTEADAFASAIEAAVVLRDSYRLSSSLAEAELNDIWNRVACEPPLTPSEIAEAVRQAYCFHPAGIGAQAGPTASAPPQRGGQATPAPSFAAEQAEQPDDVSPPSPIVETTAPSALTVATLVDTATPKPAGTTSECALCAARRKAKRERTRRWRARLREATQLGNTGVTDAQ